MWEKVRKTIRGFKEGNEEKGFGRFAKEKEYQKFEKVAPVELLAKEATAAGFPLCYDKKKNLALASLRDLVLETL